MGIVSRLDGQGCTRPWIPSRSTRNAPGWLRRDLCRCGLLLFVGAAAGIWAEATANGRLSPFCRYYSAMIRASATMWLSSNRIHGNLGNSGREIVEIPPGRVPARIDVLVKIGRNLRSFALDRVVQVDDISFRWAGIGDPAAVGRPGVVANLPVNSSQNGSPRSFPFSAWRHRRKKVEVFCCQIESLVPSEPISDDAPSGPELFHHLMPGPAFPFSVCTSRSSHLSKKRDSLFHCRKRLPLDSRVPR